MKKIYQAFLNDEDHFGAVGMRNLSKELSMEKYEQPVCGYHVLMTEPFYYTHPNEKFLLREFELCTTELSALLWKRYNGPIRMMTDQRGYEYLKDTGIFDVYDEVLPVLDRRNYGIVPSKYWAAGKIQALTKIQTPCAIIDMDLMVWKPLHLWKYSLAVAHIEHLVPFIYPEFDYFHMSSEYIIPRGWDFTIEPFNTSIMYFADETFKNYYAEQSIRFMRAEKETPDNGSICMVFAEQRILGMCAAAKKIPVHTFLDYDHLDAPQSLITHIWSAKSLIRKHKDLEKLYCDLCEAKISKLKHMKM